MPSRKAIIKVVREVADLKASWQASIGHVDNRVANVYDTIGSGAAIGRAVDNRELLTKIVLVHHNRLLVMAMLARVSKLVG